MNVPISAEIDPAPIPGSPAGDFAFRMNDLAPPALLLGRSLVHHRQEVRDGPCPIFRHQAQRRMENSRRLSLLGSLSNQTESPAGGHRLCRARRPSRTRGAGARARRGSPVSPGVDLRTRSLSGRNASLGRFPALGRLHCEIRLTRATWAARASPHATGMRIRDPPIRLQKLPAA